MSFAFRGSSAQPLILLTAVLLATGAAQGQTPPTDAGRLLQSIPPVLTPPAAQPQMPVAEPASSTSRRDGKRVVVRRFHISGATAFSEAQLLALLADAQDKALTLGELDDLVLRITRHYRDAGYLVALAYLPPQDVTDGDIRIQVQEGRLGAVKVSNKADLASSALAPLQGLQPGADIRVQDLEASLLSLADLPGVEVKSTLRPGATLGASDLLVDVTPGKAVSGSVDFDSFGNRYTGAYRLGASVFWNNPADRGDQVSLRSQVSDEGFSYHRVGYQLPVGQSATRIGATWSEMSYRLGREFSSLKAEGDASVASVYLLHPLKRSRNENWYGQVQYDDKRLGDRINSTNTDTRKTLGNWVFGVNGDLGDGLWGGGHNVLALSYTLGLLGLDSASASTDRTTARSEGGFGKWSLSLQREQRLAEQLALALSYTGQWASKNLDSSEKMMLGGATGVRAYPQGEAAGDEGHLFSAELRWQLSDSWQLQTFYDAGDVRINRTPWTTSSNSRHLAGYGVGASFLGVGFILRTFAAWRADKTLPTSDVDRSPRVWLQVAKYF